VSKFQTAADYEPAEVAWELLPFRFERFDADRVLVTNMVGEHLFVSAAELEAIVAKQLPAQSPLVRRLRAKQIVREAGDALPLELLALKTRTRLHRLPDFTALHMFVVSLRCDHSCPYCQVSRQSADKHRFDMSEETAERALEMVFESPSPQIKIEFQGGEPFLNFPLIRKIVADAETLNDHFSKELGFVIATNLALLNDEVLAFCDEHDIYISTSLDGPPDLHNRNRPRPDRDSWERAVAGIRRVREALGADRVSALMTTTEASLGRAREIIDCYLEQGLTNIFLRPLSPYGFAVKTKSHAAYDVDRWLAFYEDGLDYILELNAQGVPVVEQYAAIVLKKMLTNEDPGYVDLASPARIGIGALVYNYDGDVYASDEGRMLAEMGDTSFRLGNLHQDPYAEMLLSEALLGPLEESFTLSAPMCSDCAFEPYCGSDPVFHHATQRDPVGRKPLSAFCRRNTRIFRLLLDRYENDSAARDIFLRWAGR
jgi:His-Xaa-Ser system radical SAM maturase HxsB